MQTLTKALIDLVLAGDVEREVAANAAPNRHDFLITLERAEKAQAAELGADHALPKRLRPRSRPATSAEPPRLRMIAPTADGYGSPQ